MALSEAEICSGVIAYFDTQVLNNDQLVTISGDPVVRVGAGNQFVCYKATGGRSWWAPLTATRRPERLRIEPEWVANGYGPLEQGNVFLQDGKNTYAGPDSSFVAAAVNEGAFNDARPMVTAAGVVSIVRVVEERRGQL